MKKKILAISSGRSDFDRLSSILIEIDKSNKADLHIFLTSSYFNKVFKYDIKEISKNFKVLNKNKILKYLKDSPSQTAQNLINDAQDLKYYVDKINPDLILVIGDRYEMIIGPIIAIPNNIPVIHFFGGAVTEGAIDELVRHSLTKMSHIHYVLLESYKKRLIKMGEEKWRIKNIGMPNLHQKIKSNLKSKKDLSKDLNYDINHPFMIVTFHPVTLDLKNTSKQVFSLIKAIKLSKLNAIITFPNSDSKFNLIIKLIKKNLNNKKKYLITNALGEKKYCNLMNYAQLILGNSSSGIVEAASFNLPVVNLGDRQKGKLMPLNVINSGYESKKIIQAIKKAQSKSFKEKIRKIKNPYSSKISYKKIADDILRLKINKKLIKKKFIN